MGIEAVIFDAEGVIVDTEHLWDIGQKKFLAARNIEYNRDEVKHVIGGRSISEIVKIFQENYGFGGSVDDQVREHISNMKELFNEKVDFIPGFKDFYENQVAGRRKSAVGTSMYDELMKVVDSKLGLYKIFNNNVFTISQVGYKGKPNPDIFLYAARNIGVKPENCIVLEDAPNGIEAAKNAGMRCIALTTTYDRSKLLKADAIANSYSEIDLNKF